MDSATPRGARGLTRRQILATGVLSAGAATAGAAAAGSGLKATASAPTATTFGEQRLDFYGQHQAGILTPPQAAATFLTLDLTPQATRDDLISVLRLWTADAARLTAGKPALADTEPELAALPARLSITVGFGPELFDRIGLAERRPSSVRSLPAFSIDRLQPRWCGGQLLLQIASDDPSATSHAVRVLTKNVRSLTRIRWVQNGFRSARGSRPDGLTMRNVMGHLDGTANPQPTDLPSLVWADGADQPWFRDGTTMVLRRIQAEMDTWDELDTHARARVIGRRQDTGAPLTGNHETDKPDFAATTAGLPVIPTESHIARASSVDPRERFLRRAYNFEDTSPAGQPGVITSGLIFTAFQYDIDTQFVPVQRRLAEVDLLNEWVTPIGSAVFAIPPGIDEGDYLGQSLLSPNHSG
ncbi:Dyp-type peroxidase [Gordonia sp. IITR100]|uniref:Dyp-type peroxidase n=1 Tax=Gordonia sp. IITR100 TaxID=1314686 RepID=UPI000991373B|nr:Dyp-type peroxidase [Gordonia sp. IITR100]